MPRDHRAKFIAAKININENIFSVDKENLVYAIPEAIQKKGKYEKNSWTWKFTDIKPLPDSEPEFIFGHLVKSRYESVDVVVGDETKKFEIPDPVANRIIFLYQIKNEVLIFEEGPLNRDEIIDAFEQLVLTNNFAIGGLVINFIPEKSEIIKEIQSIDVLTKIEFDFIPPNMIEKKVYKGLTDIIKDENATRMKAVFENEKGLNRNGEFIEEGIEMVSNAYGEVKAFGHNLEPRKRGRGKKSVKKRFFSRDSIQQRKLSKQDEGELIVKLREFATDMAKLLL